MGDFEKGLSQILVLVMKYWSFYHILIFLYLFLYTSSLWQIFHCSMINILLTIPPVIMAVYLSLPTPINGAIDWKFTFPDDPLPYQPTWINSTTARARDVVVNITVTNGGAWGDWSNPVYCPKDTFAIGIKIWVSIDKTLICWVWTTYGDKWYIQYMYWAQKVEHWHNMPRNTSFQNNNFTISW